MDTKIYVESSSFLDIYVETAQLAGEARRYVRAKMMRFEAQLKGDVQA